MKAGDEAEKATNSATRQTEHDASKADLGKQLAAAETRCPKNWLLVTERLYLQQDSAKQQSGLINELKQPLTVQQDPPPTLKALLNSLMYSHDTVGLRSKTPSCLHGHFGRHPVYCALWLTEPPS